MTYEQRAKEIINDYTDALSRGESRTSLLDQLRVSGKYYDLNFYDQDYLDSLDYPDGMSEEDFNFSFDEDLDMTSFNDVIKRKIPSLDVNICSNEEIDGKIFVEVRDPVSEKYYVFSKKANAPNSGVCDLTPEGITEQEYLLYQLSGNDSLVLKKLSSKTNALPQESLNKLIDLLTDAYISRYNDIQDSLNLRRRLVFEFNEDLTLLIKHRIKQILLDPQWDFSDTFDEMLKYIVKFVPYNEVAKDYWDSIQEEDFDWSSYLSEHNLRCSLWSIKESSSISKLEKVKLISQEAGGDYNNGTNTFRFVVQDALTKRLFVFRTEPAHQEVELLTPEGLTEQEYLLYQLTHE